MVRRRKFEFFRSKTMRYFILIFTMDSAFDYMVRLGMAGKVQFDFDDPDIVPCELFIQRMHSCQECLNTLKEIDMYLQANKHEIVYYPKIDEEMMPRMSDISYIEDELATADQGLKSFIRYDSELHRNKEHLEEFCKVLQFVDHIFGHLNTEAMMHIWTNSLRLDMDKDTDEKQLQFFIGTVAKEKFFPMEKVLFRLSHNALLVKHDTVQLKIFSPFESAKTVKKVVFIVVIFGQRLAQKVQKLMNGYKAVLYDVPDTRAGRLDLQHQLENEISEIEIILDMQVEYRQDIIEHFKKNLYIWQIQLKKAMIVYQVLNKFHLRRTSSISYLQTYLWAPKEWEEDIRTILAAGKRSSINLNALQLNQLPSFQLDSFRDPINQMKAERAENSATRPRRNNEAPSLSPAIFTKIKPHPEREIPTHFDLNGFTKVFQSLIDSYGWADYKEINPAPYTIITFPFLFSVMFGDMGHGLIMTLFALALIKYNARYLAYSKQQRSPSEIALTIFNGRYIILLMGIFSIYTGFVYNDCFSKSLNLFGSHWVVRISEHDALKIKQKIELDPSSPNAYVGDPYYFGFDPIWKIAGDESIVTFNSIKMKLAIILGVFHMLFGLVLAAVNNIYYKKLSTLFLVTLPQTIIFSALFVYLTFLVFFKWSYYGGHHQTPYDTSCAPSILISFIHMILMQPDIEVHENCNAYFYKQQHILQTVLVGLIVCCLPILVVGRPLHVYFKKKRLAGKAVAPNQRNEYMERFITDIRRQMVYQLQYQLVNPKSRTHRSTVSFRPEENQVDMLEVWIHSGIHMIDSVLGAISHTASYLRLWALSLAHEQLSGVLWKMILQKSFTCTYSYYCSVLIYVFFFAWSLLTVSILVTMEGLSAFLHCLRLHWVEFQSKFYGGTGVPFIPFQFGKSSMADMK